MGRVDLGKTRRKGISVKGTAYTQIQDFQTLCSSSSKHLEAHTVDLCEQHGFKLCRIA